MRGKGYQSNTLFCLDRITPACAGKSLPESGLVFGKRDHPRVCGEKLVSISLLFLVRGSPPRVRGKVAGEIPAAAAVGITPACAGKSAVSQRGPDRGQDHPRVCGEKSIYSSLTTLFLGSPPRVRGKVLDFRQIFPMHGITPACAGKRLKKS